METRGQTTESRFTERSVSLPPLLALQAERLSRSLRAYTEKAWEVVEPSRAFVPNWHIDAICDHLQAVSDQQIRNLVITIPPRTMKSLLVCVLWPTWEWTKKPEIRQLFASYSADLSKRDSIKCRSIIESTWYQQLWGRKFQLSTDQNEKNLFGNTARGFRLATSVRGLGTGEGGDRIVCLPGYSTITTDQGDLEIGRIVDEQLPVSVLGPSGRWQEIEDYERNPGMALIELSLSNGETLSTTADHLLLTEEWGWVPASDVFSSYGKVHLIGLRENLRFSAIACDEADRHDAVSIDSARRVEAPDYVYNVRVAPDHAYYTGGVVVHNCDDPHNVNEIVSTAKREAALDWWDNTMSTRLNDPMTACKIIVMQRVHEEDLAGHVLEQGGYEHLCIPMEYGRGPTVVDFGDGKGEQEVGITSIGINDPRTEEGQLLWPERIGKEENDEYKKRLTVNYDGQMNQNPIPREGLQFKVEGFRIVPIAPNLKLKGLGRGWDKAGTEGGGAYSVGVKLGIADDGTVIIYHVTRGQWSGAKREKKMREAAELDGPRCTVVIEQEPGSAGKDQAQVSVGHLVGYPVRIERVTGDKETRAQSLADQVEYGNVILVSGSWNRDFIEECRKFPRGKYKDQVDAATVVFNYLARRKPRAGIWGKKAH